MKTLMPLSAVFTKTKTKLLPPKTEAFPTAARARYAAAQAEATVIGKYNLWH